MMIGEIKVVKGVFMGNNPTGAAYISEGRKNICVGLLAHVDAGKTTLTESLLFNTGAIRKAGRVDHGDSFLDTDPIERERGITVFSKLARMSAGGKTFILLDTPGHADLSPETERTLWVMDYALLIISASDGVTARDRALWGMLRRRDIPTFIFVNKMDMPDVDKKILLINIREDLSSLCIDFSEGIEGDIFQEEAALADEELLNKVLAGGRIGKKEITAVVKKSLMFPVYFGSALKNDGVSTLAGGMSEYMDQGEYSEDFGARIFKISRNLKGERLAWLKITGGELCVKQNISYTDGGETHSEKVDQIRIYSGEGFISEKRAVKGDICAVVGLERARAGCVAGSEKQEAPSVAEPALNYELEYKEQYDPSYVLECLKMIEEEEPKLNVQISKKTGGITVGIIGDVQAEVFLRLLKDRFGIEATLSNGSVIYRETIQKTVVGVGHFEPLKHYAEVRLLIEPLDKGGGIQIENLCGADELEPQWQKQILSYLSQSTHTGVLTGSELTDIRISLLGGRAHKKHTSGGDFRQAALRALRQGLMESVSVLLEPVFDFELTVPDEFVGRALFDLDHQGARYNAPIAKNGESLITGRGPAVGIDSYHKELRNYSSGHGRLISSFAGYEPCHNSEEIIKEIGYSAENDTDNPSFSVFCSHGAGVIVPWYKVKERMHTTLETFEKDSNEKEISEKRVITTEKEGLNEKGGFKESAAQTEAEEKELKEIFERTYGAKKEKGERRRWKRELCDPVQPSNPGSSKRKNDEKKYLLVDGYNIIFAWEELKELAKGDMAAARDRLLDIMSDYQGATKETVIVVFDAYKVRGGIEEVLKYNNIYAVYTKESETADQYIEKTVHEIGKDNMVTVATSDTLEQMIILGSGAIRLSAEGLQKAVSENKEELRREYLEKIPRNRNYFAENITKEVRDALEEEK